MTTTAMTDADLARITADALVNLDTWKHQCHAAAIHVVKARVLPDGARVARGTADRVGAQHSWIVLGDPYDRNVRIIDPTMWSYRSDVDGVWVGTAADGIHRPFGSDGDIWTYGRPPTAAERDEEPIAIPTDGLSDNARRFLDLCGPLGRTGWSILLHGPVSGWPAAEIIDAACDVPVLSAMAPIDIVGMLTDRNPGGLYLPDREDDR